MTAVGCYPGECIYTWLCMGSGFVSTECCQSEERWLTIVATPLITIPHWYSVVDMINARRSRFVLLVRTEAISLMLLANVNSCPKVHEVIDVIAVVGQRPQFLN